MKEPHTVYDFNYLTSLKRQKFERVRRWVNAGTQRSGEGHEWGARLSARVVILNDAGMAGA